ncbi:MAG: sporulation transcriptional regulator SpoIIID [Clostridia bacterium]|nr:sporulation transcriptional regulator SpoIIID [Clostridia bacterium]MBQ5834376.1 sporulation transcriptional regulator SpoIIID [Clostridia bacterium]
MVDWNGKERCVALAEYLIENQSTVRSVAQIFGVSKSTVHKDVTQTLKHVDKALYREVQKVLQKNKEERHLRGGEATRLKYCESGKKRACEKREVI